MPDVDLSDELYALTSLVGSVALMLMRQVTVESHLLHTAPGERAITDPLARFVVETEALEGVLGLVQQGRQKSGSYLLGRLADRLQERLDNVNKGGPSQFAEGQPKLADVIELFPQRCDKET
jgi:hypothetical protein